MWQELAYNLRPPLFLYLEKLELLPAPETACIVQFNVVKVRFKTVTDYKGYTLVSINNFIVGLS